MKWCKIIICSTSAFIIDRLLGKKFGWEKTFESGVQIYRCNHRRTGENCNVTIHLDGKAIRQAGELCQSCTSYPNLYELLVITRAAKGEGIKQPGRSANLIVEDIMLQEFETKNGKMALAKSRNVNQSLNRARANTRAKHPKDLNFDLNLDAAPSNFKVAEVFVGKGKRGVRHLIMYSPEQLAILATSRSIYGDGTFKMC